MTLKKLIAIAIEHHGSQQKLADAIGCSQPWVNHLLNHGKPKDVKAETAVAIEKSTAGKVRREQLRPDLWGPT